MTPPLPVLKWKRTWHGVPVLHLCEKQICVPQMLESNVRNTHIYVLPILDEPCHSLQCIPKANAAGRDLEGVTRFSYSNCFEQLLLKYITIPPQAKANVERRSCVLVVGDCELHEALGVG